MLDQAAALHPHVESLKFPKLHVPLSFDPTRTSEKLHVEIKNFDTTAWHAFVEFNTPAGTFSVDAQQIAAIGSFKIAKLDMLARYAAIGILEGLKDDKVKSFVPPALAVTHERGRVTVCMGSEPSASFLCDTEDALKRLVTKLNSILNVAKVESPVTTVLATIAPDTATTATELKLPPVSPVNTGDAASNTPAVERTSPPHYALLTLETGMVFENTQSGTQRALIIDREVAKIYVRKAGDSEWNHEEDENTESLRRSYMALVNSGDYRLLDSRVPQTDLTPFT